MKIKDVAHNHSLTDLLKVSIFSLLMLAPMINVGVRSAYVICNKNAYQSYYGETINQITYEDVTEFKTNERYQFSNNITTQIYVTSTASINYEFIQVNNSTGISAANVENIKQSYNFIIAYDSNTNSNYVRFAYGTGQFVYVAFNNASISFDFIYIEGTNLQNTMYPLFKIRQVNNYSYLDNVFEYSVNQLTESPLYNWVENTAIYSGVALMNTQLGITQPVISLLVVYWLLLTIIYIIIDIVIRVFTWLTHMIGSKTA